MVETNTKTPPVDSDKKPTDSRNSSFFKFNPQQAFDISAAAARRRLLEQPETSNGNG